MLGEGGRLVEDSREAAPFVYKLEGDLYPVRIAGKRISERQIAEGLDGELEEEWDMQCEELEKENEESARAYEEALDGDGWFGNFYINGDDYIEDPGPEPFLDVPGLRGVY